MQPAHDHSGTACDVSRATAMESRPSPSTRPLAATIMYVACERGARLRHINAIKAPIKRGIVQ